MSVSPGSRGCEEPQGQGSPWASSARVSLFTPCERLSSLIVLLLFQQRAICSPVLLLLRVGALFQWDLLLFRVTAFQKSSVTARKWLFARSSPRLTSIEPVMPSSHLILCHPLLLLPSIPPSIRVFSNESTLRMRWPKYWSFSFSIIPSKETPGLMPLAVSLETLGLWCLQVRGLQTGPGCGRRGWGGLHLIGNTPGGSPTWKARGQSSCLVGASWVLGSSAGQPRPCREALLGEGLA